MSGSSGCAVGTRRESGPLALGPVRRVRAPVRWILLSSVLSSGGDEACASQCPDAPTAFYSMPAGSEKIDDAVSLTGAPYSALPVRNRK